MGCTALRLYNLNVCRLFVGNRQVNSRMLTPTPDSCHHAILCGSFSIAGRITKKGTSGTVKIALNGKHFCAVHRGCGPCGVPAFNCPGLHLGLVVRCASNDVRHVGDSRG